MEIKMSVQTRPNPIYVRLQQSRKGFVEPNAWAAALRRAGVNLKPTSAAEARRCFNEVRKAYWPIRLQLAATGEFNSYNAEKMRQGEAPIGPDGFSIELDHREELAKNPGRALDATNIWEIFRRQHDFQHGNYAFRWHMGSFPQSPLEKDLPRKFGDPTKHKDWP
jgi:hypothetical protein